MLPNCKTNTHRLKNISYGNIVFTEQLFEVGEPFLEQTLRKTELVSEHAFCSQTMGESSFKVKFMFELATLYIIFNMATSNINKMNIYKKK